MIPGAFFIYRISSNKRPQRLLNLETKVWRRSLEDVIWGPALIRGNTVLWKRSDISDRFTVKKKYEKHNFYVGNWAIAKTLSQLWVIVNQIWLMNGDR